MRPFDKPGITRQEIFPPSTLHPPPSDLCSLFPMSPREIAFEILSAWHGQGARGRVQLDARLAAAGLTPGERALATELTHGPIRRRATLDALVGLHSKRPLRQIEPDLLTLLHLGAYQLVLLSGAPAYAVVDETVELAKRRGRSDAAGFVNAVLRALGRTVTTETVRQPGPAAVPLTDGRYRRLQGDVFADPASDPAGYFAAAFSFPPWLVKRWRQRFGFDELVEHGFWFNTPAPMTLRVNTLHTTRDEMLAALKTAGIDAESGMHADSIRLAATLPVATLPGFDAGWFTVQDESAIAAAARLAPSPGERVLDLCAAPGGKTAHLAALMQNSGTIVASDVSRERLVLIEQNCRRLGVSIVETRLVGRELADLPVGPFDAVLVDVPCSNTGVLGKRPEARWRLQPSDISELARLQGRLLKAALSRARAGGRVLYSTCSIEPEENEQVVAQVVGEQPAWKLIDERQHRPGHLADGGYQALLRRSEPPDTIPP